MLNRRSFLLKSIAILMTGQFISGCSNQQKILKVLLLQGSIPPQLLNDFRKTLHNGTKLNFAPKSQLNKLFDLLASWQQQNENQSNEPNIFLNMLKRTETIADLVTLSDYQLSSAIKQGLIQPFDISQLKNWHQLPSAWQTLVRRNSEGEIDCEGKIYGAPYRWGNTIIAYRRDKFKALGWTPQDWSDLWRTELQERISLLDEPREVIGLTLKKLGYSYNTNNLTQVSNLKSELEALHKQVKFYSSTNYLQPLILGDTWVAVGWSTDILPLLKRYSDIKIVVPKSGTSLWTDLWVQPNYLSVSIDEDKLPLGDRWIDFCWQPKAANQISLFTNAISPALAKNKSANLGKNLQNNYFVKSSLEVLPQSDFLENLSPDLEKQYLSLWQEIRSSSTS